MMTKNAVFLCCDSGYFALARGTVLSLNELYPDRDLFAICFLDIGLEDSQRQWMIEQGAIVKNFDDLKIFASLPVHFKNYHKSLVVRPFLPRIFPGYDVYTMVDTDIWFQNRDAIATFFDYAARYAPKIVIVPTVDYTYDRLNYMSYAEENNGNFLGHIKRWYDAVYDEKVSINLFGRVLFSAGLFALHRDSHVWGLWAKEFETVFNTDFTHKPWMIHLSEQSALNKVIYDTNDFVPLPASFNYNCHIGSAQRDKDTGRVVTGYPPYPEIGAIHLTYGSKYMPSYLEKGLLYQSGSYLTPEEIVHLGKLNHF
jgi:hypothetical protein